MPAQGTFGQTFMTVSASHSLRRATALVTAASFVPTTLPSARAQDGPRPPPIIRDAEIEQLLRDYTAPILRTAGLTQQNVQVVIINEPTFNAFVVDARRIFVNSGALMESQTPNQIIGVLAHETGHIAGGHLAKLREQLARAQTQMILATILGVGAMVAGASTNRSGSSGLGQAGTAAISAPQEMIRRTILSYQRQQEESADRAAVRYLNDDAPVAEGHVRDVQANVRTVAVPRPRRRPLFTVSSDAGRARRRARRIRKDEPVLGQEGRPVAATAARPDARQDLRLHGAARYRAAPLSDVERQPAGALCARHLRLQARRSAQRRRPDRRPAAGAAEQCLLL